jgi:hypothetical protein
VDRRPRDRTAHRRAARPPACSSGVT